MRATIDLSSSEIDKFRGACNITISKVGKNTRKGTVAACEAILNASLAQVPRDTETLASSASYKVDGYYKTGWEGKVGYAMDVDPVNPKSGRAVSGYVLKVHEDLTAYHPVGKAKFLEDPAREFAKENFPRTVFKYFKESLTDFGG